MQTMEKSTRFLAIILICLCLGVSSASAAGVASGSAKRSALTPRVTPLALDKQEAAVDRYIVLLSDPALAVYEGGVDGLKATNPKAAGLKKLDLAGAASQAYLNYLSGRQDEVLSALGGLLGQSPQVYKRYKMVLNGYCVKLTAAQAKKAARLKGVKAVLPDFKAHAQTDAGPQWIGAPDVWNGVGGVTGTKGEGIVVGIIDSGINPLNPSFADVGGDGYDHTNPRGQYYGACNPDDPYFDETFPCNDKLIGAWDFARDEGDPYNPIDDGGHGSHTASTTAGNVTTAAMEVEAAPDDPLVRQISGVAPHANIISYRGLEEGSGWTSWLAAAIEQAVIDQVDVINYSIGGIPYDPWVRPDALAFLAAREAGVFVAVSAGNDGPEAGTIGGPADAPWVLSVGASSHDRFLRSTLCGFQSEGGTTLADIQGTGITGEYGPAGIVYAGDYTNPNDPDGDPGLCDEPFPAGTFNGEIVICDRGRAYFDERLAKGSNVMAGGAGGMVLANGSVEQDGLVSMNHVLPAVNISYDDTAALMDWLAAGSGHTATISPYSVVENDTARADMVSQYSSRGPNPTLMDVIKPDISAPGQNIFAAYGADGAVEYAVLIGTSMAGPHAAGAGALLKAARPELTPAEMQSALMTTAQTELRKEDNSTPADPFDIGGGRIDVSRAAQAALVLDETVENYLAVDPYFGGDPSTLNLASLGKKDAVHTHTWTRTLRSSLGGESTWTAAVANPAGVSLSVSPNPVTVPAGGSQEIQITADLSQATLDQWLLGRVTFESTDQMSVGMPVAVRQVISNLESYLYFPDSYQKDSGSIKMTSAVDITDFTAVITGMAPGEIHTGRIYQDPTPDDPFDDLTPEGGVLLIEKVVGQGATRLVTEISQTTSPDVDLFVINGDTGDLVCYSTTYTSAEYCNVNDPAAGTYMIVVQNWEASDPTGEMPDSVEVVVADVPNTDSGHLKISAVVPSTQKQTAIPAGREFDLRLDWYLGEASPFWYGGFTIGTDPANPANLGQTNLDILHNGQIPGGGGTGGGSGCFLQTTR